MVEEARSLRVTLASGSSSSNKYPAPLAKYEDVVADRQLFMSTLEKLHSVMGTKFMIPIIGGRDLDLHKLFVEVTSRGGVEKILREKRWKEITLTFNFPSTATNASYVLRKYYHSLLQNYEQIYYFKLHGSGHSAPSSTVALQTFGMPPSTVQTPNTAIVDQLRVNTNDIPSGEVAASCAGSPVIGVIDGKFDSGYLVTIRIGEDTLKGVLYQAPPAHNNVDQVPQPLNISTDKINSTPKSGMSRKRRRRKSELRKRDPAHPKPNRSGYNFFFSEQHARLKPLHPGKDREISRMIGELWNNLHDDDRAIYREKAEKDKERYKKEMEEYREKLRENQVISDAVPIQQRFPFFDINMAEADMKDDSDCSMSGTEEDDEYDDDNNNILPVKDDESFSEPETSNADARAGDFQVVQEDESKQNSPS